MVRDRATAEYNITGDPDDPGNGKDPDEPGSHGGNSPPRGRHPGGGGPPRGEQQGGDPPRRLKMIQTTVIQAKMMKMKSLRITSEEIPPNIPMRMGSEPDATI